MIARTDPFSSRLHEHGLKAIAALKVTRDKLAPMVLHRG